MKKTFPLIICIIISFVLLFNIDTFSDYIANFLDEEKKVYIKDSNIYHRDYDFMFVQQSTKYIPYSYQGLLNIIYSTLNNGWDTFTFYCPEEYENCLKDVSSISEDATLLSTINNFVHPYNSYSKIGITTIDNGEVTININKLYNTNDIEMIENETDRIITEIITPDMSDDDKLLKIHDYIINNTRYDTEKKHDESYIALGPILTHSAVCSGYADLMAIFLEKLNIKNYKIASDTHVWNAVYINDEWLHLDLTWDDPITKDSNVDTLQHDFFLIKTDKLLEFDINDHVFDSTIYQEFD